MPITNESIAYWYFRLNGFLTNVNFILHPETIRDSCTDIDIVGVRFPYRSENILRPMDDDSRIINLGKGPYVVFAEIKTGMCNLNGPWINSQSNNMEKALKALGICGNRRIPIIAKSLYDTGIYSCGSYNISMVCVGRETNEYIRERYSKVPQIKYDDALSFIYQRLKMYQRDKAQHSQWDENGHRLWDIAMASSEETVFIDSVKREAFLA